MVVKELLGRLDTRPNNPNRDALKADLAAYAPDVRIVVPRRLGNVLSGERRYFVDEAYAPASGAYLRLVAADVFVWPGL